MKLLVLDIGSSSARALLYDETFQLHAAASRPVGFSTDGDGASTVDAASLRLLVESCIDEVLQHAAADRIDAVGMASFVGNLMGTDRDNRPLTPIFTYADTQSADDAVALRREADDYTVLQRTGCPIHAAYAPARLRWLARTGVSAARWTDFASHFYRHWLGQDVPCSYSIAAWNGLLNRQALNWDEAWLEALGLTADALPPLADYRRAQTGLSAAYAERWSALRDARFFLAIGDGAAANIGSGADEPQTLALTVGTTAALRRVMRGEAPVVPRGLWSYRVDGDRHLLGGATTEGGSVYAWVRKVIDVADNAETLLLGRPADAHGLTFLPLLAGERSPGYRADATGTLHGLRLSSTPLDILQASLEGVALRLAAIAELLAGDASVERIHAGGGALVSSAAWAQIMADALDRPLTLIDEPQPTARGVALLMLEALGVDIQPRRMPSLMQTLTPRPDAAAALRAARERQRALYARLYDVPEGIA